MSATGGREFNVESIRADFPILARSVRDRELVYLDNAASTMKPIQVIDRISRYYREEVSNVHRGAHFLAEQGTVAYEGAREKVREFIGARDVSEVIFTRGTTESVNLVAQTYGRANLREGDEIILTEMEHHSNIVPWQMIASEKGAVLKVIPVTDEGALDKSAFKKLLSDRTKILALTWCSNALGTINDVAFFAREAHAAGAVAFVDAAQAAPQMLIDVKEIDCDFLAFSGHKVFGPYGIGILYGKSALLENMPPYQGGGSMISEVSFEKTTWAVVPHKFEAGTPHISGAIGLGAALQYMQDLGFKAIEKHEQDLLAYATSEIGTIPGVRILGSRSGKAAILSFVVEGAHASDIGALVDQQGIAIRAGHHCCQPLMRRLGVPATARASFSIYNTRREVDLLKTSLLKAKEFI